MHNPAARTMDARERLRDLTETASQVLSLLPKRSDDADELVECLAWLESEIMSARICLENPETKT